MHAHPFNCLRMRLVDFPLEALRGSCRMPYTDALAALQLATLPQSRRRDMRCSALAPMYLTLLAAATAIAQQSPTRVPTQADDCTRYEVLAPRSARCRLADDVSETAVGETQFVTP